MFKAGTYKQQYEYKSFSPSFVNKAFEWRDKQITLRILIKSAAFLFQFGHHSAEFGHVKNLAVLG